MSSFSKYTADGATVLYQVTFPYLQRAHVELRRNGILMLTPGDYEWLSSNQIRLRTALPQGTILQIRRVTPDASLVTFTNGSVLTEEDLNTAVKQALYRNEELRDELNGYVSDAVSHFGTNGPTAGMSAEELINQVASSILNSQLLADLQTRIGDIDTNAESIIEQSVRLDDFEDLVESIAYVDGQPVGVFAANERTERVDGDLALQSQLNVIGAKSGDGLSWILDQDSVMVSPTESLAQRLTSIATTDANNAAAITTEQQARIAGDAALASTLTALSAQVDDNAAAISIEQQARADEDSALATSISTLAADLSSDIGEVSAAVQDVVTAYAAGGLASASSVSTLQATVNDNTASLQTVQEVVSGTGGLSSQYMVKLDVNGYVTGFGQYNDGSSGYFYILADKFAVVTPGSSPTVPFAISSGTCYMQNVVIDGALIQNASITNAKIENLTITTLKLADAVITSAKIQDLAVTSAKIQSLAVTSAKIANAAVNSLKIAGYSVILPVSAEKGAGQGGASVTVTITADDIPTGYSTVPVIVIGSQDCKRTAFFDMGYTTASTFTAWTTAGNLKTATRGASVSAYSSLVNLGPGTYTFAMYEHSDGAGGDADDVSSQSITVLVGKR